MTLQPTYLRVVVTARCSLACGYCHQEGDPATAQAGGLSTDELGELLEVAVDQGVRKLKLLGGEPLLRADLPQVVRRLRAHDPTLDISLITAGVAPVERLAACFDAGLSRANLSIHGWSEVAFAERTHRAAAALARRQAVLDLLLAEGHFLKLNFVWRGPRDDADLAGLLEWAADQPVVVGVLDDLSDPTLGPGAVQAALIGLRGVPSDVRAEPDPHSLPTRRLRWADGLQVEIKDHHLGQIAPWQACAACPQRARCREGIHALRLSHDGRLRPCMDRPDIGADLLAPLRARDASPGATWSAAVSQWVTSPSRSQTEAA